MYTDDDAIKKRVVDAIKEDSKETKREWTKSKHKIYKTLYRIIINGTYFTLLLKYNDKC